MASLKVWMEHTGVKPTARSEVHHKWSKLYKMLLAMGVSQSSLLYGGTWRG